MLTSFPVAQRPSPTKRRGGYYTPPPLAKFLADWVASAGPKILEPSCGDGAILGELPNSGQVQAVELLPSEAAKARLAAPGASVAEADFFQWFSIDQLGTWDGVVGNPPFIRFQNKISTHHPGNTVVNRRLRRRILPRR